MVETIYIKHPLTHNFASATWWIITYLIRAVAEVAMIFCLAASTPWSENMSDRAVFFLLAAAGVGLLGQIAARFTARQVNFYTPGYMAYYSIFDRVDVHNPALDKMAELSLSLITLTSFYLFNPGNSTYSTLAMAVGLALIIRSLSYLTFKGFALISNRRIKDRYWDLFLPLTTLLVIGPFYRIFPDYVGVEGQKELAAVFLGCVLNIWLIVSMPKIMNMIREL